MAEPKKLNAISRAWSQKDKADFAKGLSGGASKKAAPKEAPEGEMAGIERGIASMQASNAKNPGIQTKLNAVSKARAKFYGEDAEAPEAPKAKRTKKPEVYPAEE